MALYGETHLLLDDKKVWTKTVNGLTRTVHVDLDSDQQIVPCSYLVLREFLEDAGWTEVTTPNEENTSG